LDMYQEGDCFVFLLQRNSNEAARFHLNPAAKSEERGGQKANGRSLKVDR
jgi:hypothetical protein